MCDRNVRFFFFQSSVEVLQSVLFRQASRRVGVLTPSAAVETGGAGTNVLNTHSEVRLY